MKENRLTWQSKTVLLAVLPAAAASIVLSAPQFWSADRAFVLASLLLCALLGLLVPRLRAGTWGAGFTGALVAASLIFATASYPYRPWKTALAPLLAVFVLTLAATRSGRARKEALGLAEHRRGRNAAQVAANLGASALAALQSASSWLAGAGGLERPSLLLAPALAALAEAAADTVSSEIGQSFGGAPRLLTTLRPVAPGEDGGLTLIGTLAGAAAGALTAALGAWALGGDARLFLLSWGGALFGLFFDSLLGATIERRGWLNNDAVNFLSTLAAAAGAALLLALPRLMR